MDFSAIIDMIQENIYVFGAMVAACIGSVIFTILRNKKMKEDGSNFIKLHPDAARVYLTTKALAVTEAVTVYTVNGKEPSRFVDKGKTGFYVTPGHSTVEVSYSYTRPGVLHKTVTTSTDVVEKILETKARQSYFIGFDRKAECFTFEDYASSGTLEA